MSGIPMTTCVVCKKEVTKRSTIALQPLFGKEGRGCRNHPEIALVLESKKEFDSLAFQLNSQLAEVQRRAEVRSAVAVIRVCCTFDGKTIQGAVSELRAMGAPEPIITAALQEVEKMGAVMTSEERRRTIKLAVEMTKSGVS